MYVRSVRGIGQAPSGGAAYLEAMERSRDRVYATHRMQQLFVEDTASPLTAEQIEILPSCVSQARHDEASAACAENNLAIGPAGDPLVEAGLSECGVSRMRVCGEGDEAELDKTEGALSGNWLLIGAGVAAGGTLLYLLFR